MIAYHLCLDYNAVIGPGGYEMQSLADDRYIVISSDGHAGAEMHDYRNYLERRYLDGVRCLGEVLCEPIRRSAGGDGLSQLGFRRPSPRARG